MFIPNLSKAEREEASKFNPKNWEGEYVKIIKSYCPREKEKYGSTDSVAYCKLSEYVKTKDIPGFELYEYNGIYVGSEYGGVVYDIKLKFSITLYHATSCQYEIIPITREEFIDGCKSLLSSDLQELINLDRV